MSKYRVQGISFPDEALFQAAIARADAEGRSLSNYICRLLEADLFQNSPEYRIAKEAALNDRPAPEGERPKTVKEVRYRRRPRIKVMTSVKKSSPVSPHVEPATGAAIKLVSDNLRKP